MKLNRKALALGFAVAAISAAACSSQHGSTTGSGNGGGSSAGIIGDGQTGSVGMHLNIPNGNGVTVSSLNWTISNGTNTYTGTINMTDDAGNAAQSIEFVAGPVLAGSGYTVTLSGSDSNGDPCTGTSPAFTVTPGTSMTAQAAVNITCTAPTDAALSTTVDTGSVAVDAGVTLVNQAPFQCPAITGVSISPAELHPPQSSTIIGGVTGGSGGTPTLLWTSTCGTGAAIIGTPTAANTTFSCGTAINTNCTLTLTVGLLGTAADGGTVGQVCGGVTNTSISETIHCENGGVTLPTCSTGFTQCGNAEAGTDCENLSNGSGPNHLCGSACGTATVCGGTTPTCQAGVCVSQPPTACTTAPCAASGPNSLKCTGNGTTGTNAGVCTATQAVLMNLSQACYTCAQSNFCLDNSSNSGFECGDVTASFTNGAGAVVNGPSTCVSTLQCITGSTGMSCPSNTNGISDCYCGPSLTSTQCTTSTAQNGPCLSQEIAGFLYTPGSTAANTILGEFTTQTQPSGNANALAACAVSNCATQCGAF